MIVSCACGQEIGRVDDAGNGRIAGRSINIRDGRLEVKCRACDTYHPFPATIRLEPQPAPRIRVRVSGAQPPPATT